MKMKMRKAIWDDYSWQLNRLFLMINIEFAASAIAGAVLLISSEVADSLGPGTKVLGWLLTIIAAVLMSLFLTMEMASWDAADFVAKAESIFFLMIACVMSPFNQAAAVLNAACGYVVYYTWRSVSAKLPRDYDLKGTMNNER